MPDRADLSSEDARRLALSSLGFGGQKLRRVGTPQVRATAERLGAIQIDSVNVLARAHYLPTFSRYGPYRMSALDELAHVRRELFEYWGHAACFLPIELYPLMRWRMDNQREAWKGLSRKRKTFMDAVYQEVTERGPIAASELSNGGRSKGPWWGWSDGKEALELLFSQGRLAIAGRRHFERLYDLPGRLFPKAILDAPALPPSDAKKALLVRATRAMGIGTAKDIAQYFHIDAWWDRVTVKGRRAPAKVGVLFEELVEEGRLERVRVEHWRESGYLIPGVRIPTSIGAASIVSPFDPVLWERKWTKAVFGFDYQIEIYVPAARRIYGYYVLPFLLGDRFAARVDLKADRRTSTLIVHAAYVEPGFDSRRVASALAGELRSVAAWLSLASIVVHPKGDLAKALERRIATSHDVS
jgi:uncharacterized protein YcaQ